jgi:hypothetical protein
MIVVLPLLSSPTQTIRTFLLLLLRPSELKSILKRPMAALACRRWRSLVKAKVVSGRNFTGKSLWNHRSAWFVRSSQKHRDYCNHSTT